MRMNTPEFDEVGFYQKWHSYRREAWKEGWGPVIRVAVTVALGAMFFISVGMFIGSHYLPWEDCYTNHI